jgi:hypothetical protein
MGLWENRLKLTSEQENKLSGFFESFWATLPSGQGAKVGKGGARDAFFKKFKKVKEENWLELLNRIKEAMIAQEAHRKRIFRDYPDERSRKQSGVFLPSRPHPATWINQERWHDEIKKFEEKAEVVGESCMECQLDGAHFVEGGMLCDWHWTKKFNHAHLRMLYDNLKSMGLGVAEGESKAEWSERCRQWLQKQEYSGILKT